VCLCVCVFWRAGVQTQFVRRIRSVRPVGPPFSRRVITERKSFGPLDLDSTDRRASPIARAIATDSGGKKNDDCV
jgi:hypothetical protein